MDSHSRSLLEKLLFMGEREAAGIRSKPSALTKMHLAKYQALRSLQKKESIETTFKAARATGAIELTWEDVTTNTGFIQRVNLVSLSKLADFLGVVTVSDQVFEARTQLEPYMARFQVLNEIIISWEQLRKVRGLGPIDVQQWVDAARTIIHMSDAVNSKSVDKPIRDVSAKLFKNSKRIEKLTAAIDVLLTGEPASQAREAREVWQELGLFREEQPIRMAGKVVIERTRVSSVLDTPYSAFSAQSIVELASVPEMLMTIENLTTFHSEARRRCDENILLIYTAGMPSPAWCAMYLRLLLTLPAEASVYHWGDIDEGGFRIAAKLAEITRDAGHILKPWLMSPDDIPIEQRVPASQGTLQRIKKYAAAAGWESLGIDIEAAGFTTEQEGIC